MKEAKSLPLVDRVIAWSMTYSLSPPLRYLAATALLSAVALVRALFVTNLLPYLLFIPCVLILSLTLRQMAIFASVLSAVLAALTIGHAANPWWLTGLQWIANTLYLVVIFGVALLGQELRAAFIRSRELEADRAEAQAMLLERSEQLRLLNRELGHRLKNLLTIVQAIATQTIRQSEDLKSANDSLVLRLAALGRATDVLTATEWNEAELHALVQSSLAGHSAVAARFRIDGPQIRFGPQIGLALTLALHELTTNAIKYGALSNDHGHVELHWSVVSASDGDRFRFEWREVGGPAVQQPSRRGFGSTMIERSLSAYFGGAAAIRYDPTGVVFEVDAPMSAALH